MGNKTDDLDHTKSMDRFITLASYPPPIFLQTLYKSTTICITKITEADYNTH